MTMLLLETARSVDVLGREMIAMELMARQAEEVEHWDRAQRLWFERDQVRHERSLAMRRHWALRAEAWGW